MRKKDISHRNSLRRTKQISLILFLIFAGLFFNSCRKYSALKVNTNVNIHIPRYFYKRLEGKINGKYHIVINLTGKDTLLRGDMYFINKGIPDFFDFKSSIDSINSFTIITSTGELFNNTGIKIPVKLTGKFVNTNQMKGIIGSKEKQATFKFHLNEIYPKGSYKFIMKRTGRAIGSRDSGGAFIEYIFPQLTGDKTKEMDSVNRKIFGSIVVEYENGYKENKFDNFDSEMNDFLERFEKFRKSPLYSSGYKPFWENSFFAKIVFNSDNIIVLENTDFRFEGGAHPNTFFNFYNYNVKKGKLIFLRDIFRKGYKTELDKIGEKRFKETYNIKPDESLESKGYFLRNHKFHLNQNFAVFEKGLLFKFNQYEIAPYVYGAPEVFIPYKNLRKILKPGSVVSGFIK